MILHQTLLYNIMYVNLGPCEGSPGAVCLLLLHATWHKGSIGHQLCLQEELWLCPTPFQHPTGINLRGMENKLILPSNLLPIFILVGEVFVGLARYFLWILVTEISSFITFQRALLHHVSYKSYM